MLIMMLDIRKQTPGGNVGRIMDGGILELFKTFRNLIMNEVIALPSTQNIQKFVTRTQAASDNGHRKLGKTAKFLKSATGHGIVAFKIYNLCNVSISIFLRIVSINLLSRCS